jgi:hypothetical protein
MAKLALVTALCLNVVAAQAYTLRPTEETDHGFTVTVDQQPIEHLGRTVALPSGATLTVTSSNDRRFETALIGPSGVKHGRAKRTWRTRLEQTGGYKLQFGSERDWSLSQLDFVVTDDPASVARPGGEDRE